MDKSSRSVVELLNVIPHLLALSPNPSPKCGRGAFKA